MANILVIEDEELFAQALKTTIEYAGHDVDVCSDGQVAIELLSDTAKKYDCILSDIQMPKVNGVQLLQWVKMHLTTPVILMTGYSEIMTTDQANKYLADDFLLKPYNEAQILAVLNKVLLKVPVLVEKTGEVSQTHVQMLLKIPRNCFMLNQKSDYDFYIRNSDSFQKIISRGEVIDRNVISKYAHLDIYTDKENVQKLLNMNMLITKVVSGNNKLERQKRNDFMRITGELLNEKLYIDGFDKSAWHAATEYVSCLLNFAQDSMLIDLLASLNRSKNFTYINTLGVTCTALMLADRMCWSKDKLSHVVMSGLLHDIGKTKLNVDLINKPDALLSFTEKVQIQQHCELGRQILAESKLVSDDIINIVHQHHEKCDGSGYPQKLTKDKIHPTARLIFIADLFCQHALRNLNSLGMSANKAIERMQSDTGYDLDYFKVLKTLCNNNITGEGFSA